MALILAIEPDRRQVSKLTMLARNYRHTELVVTDSIGRALAMLDERLPDLILTSSQLQSKHRAALMDRLLEVDADGTRVQTLVIPALGAPIGRASPQKGMPARPNGNRGHQTAGNAGDVLFGRQIAQCLERIPPERRSASVKEWAPAVSPMISVPEPAEAEETGPSELPVTQRAGITAAPERAPSSRLARPEWGELLSTIRRDLDHMRAEHAEPSADTTPAETLTSAWSVDSPARIRRRTAPAPAHDEWSVFDPQERGIAARFVNPNPMSHTEKIRTKKSL